MAVYTASGHNTSELYYYWQINKRSAGIQAAFCYYSQIVGMQTKIGEEGQPKSFLQVNQQFNKSKNCIKGLIKCLIRT
jgi:hypothetical protein